MTQNELRKQITEKILEALQKGTKPWTRPWAIVGGGPQNAMSGHVYRGMNVILTALHQMEFDFSSPFYATANQWSKAGCRIMKRPDDVPAGGWGCSIIKFEIMRKTEKDKTTGEETNSVFPLMRTWHVFNADQVVLTDDMKAKLDAKIKGSRPKDFKPVKKAEDLIKKSGAEVRFGGDRAYYAPAPDFIQMPPKKAFTSQNGYYGTFLHELVHWSGGEKRLRRIDKLARFGDSSYALEELIAEIGSTFLQGWCGLDVLENIPHHASYVKSWIKVLKNDDKAIFTAASAATKATDYILELSGVKVNDYGKDSEVA